MPDITYKKWLIAIFFLALLWSGFRPHDYFTWLLEVTPALLGLAALIFFEKKYSFTFSKPLYFLMLLHAIVLMIGGHWTYAEVPLFNWLRDIGLFGRNNYDKIGHFMQGFVPVLLVREVLIKKSPLGGSRWLGFLSASVVLALAAVYEFIEWWVSLLSGSAGDSFLGTQGYIWDTQSDMFLCMLGAIAGLFFLSKLQDKYLR